MKRRFTLLAIATFVSTSLMAAWTGNSSIWTNGSGDQDDPYLIESEANLAYLASQVNSGTDYTGVYFKQMADLNLGGVQKADGTWDERISNHYLTANDMIKIANYALKSRFFTILETSS